MLDYRPVKKVSFNVDSDDDLQELETLYKSCSKIQSDMIENMNNLDVVRQDVEKLQRVLKEALLNLEKEREKLENLSDNLQTEQESLADLLYKIIDGSITDSERSRVETLISESNGMKNSSLEELIKDNIQNDFDCEFVNRKVVLNKPNPIISRVFHKERLKEFPLEQIGSDQVGNSDGEL